MAASRCSALHEHTRINEAPPGHLTVCWILPGRCLAVHAELALSKQPFAPAISPRDLCARLTTSDVIACTSDCGAQCAGCGVCCNILSGRGFILGPVVHSHAQVLTGKADFRAFRNGVSSSGEGRVIGHTAVVVACVAVLMAVVATAVAAFLLVWRRRRAAAHRERGGASSAAEAPLRRSATLGAPHMIQMSQSTDMSGRNSSLQVCASHSLRYPCVPAAVGKVHA